MVIFFLLGLCFGFAARLPWGLLAFLFPLALVITASDRDPVAIVIGFVVTAIGVAAGLLLATRTDQRSTA